MGEIRSYRDPDVWQLGIELVLDCYALTRRFPTDERYGLTSQARRAAVSMPSNVAEGHNRRTPHSSSAYRNHVAIALGSNGELDTLLELALRLKYVQTGDVAPINEKLGRIGKMLRRLQQSLEKEHQPPGR